MNKSEEELSVLFAEALARSEGWAIVLPDCVTFARFESEEIARECAEWNYGGGTHHGINCGPPFSGWRLLPPEEAKKHHKPAPREAS